MNVQEGNVLVSAIDGLVRRGAFIFNKCVFHMSDSHSLAKMCKASLDAMVVSFVNTATNMSQFKDKDKSYFDSDELVHINQELIVVLQVLFDNVIKAKKYCTAYIGILKSSN